MHVKLGVPDITMVENHCYSCNIILLNEGLWLDIFWNGGPRASVNLLGGSQNEIVWEPLDWTTPHAYYAIASFALVFEIS